jgi:phage tail tube protein FII
MKPIINLFRIGLVATFMLTFLASTPIDSFAQNKKESKITVRSKAKAGEKSNETIVVEVKDGKVFVDGKEVAEVDTEGRRVWVKSGDDGSEGNGGKNTFTFSGTDMDMDMDENHLLYEMDGSHFMSKTAPLMERLNSEMGEARMQARMAPMMDRAFAYSNGANTYSVLANEFSMESNGEVMKMDMKSRELAMQIRREDGDTSKLETELDQLLAEIYTTKQEANQKRVDKLRSELEKLEQNLTDRSSIKSDIIAKRKKELLGQADKYDW